MDNDVKPVPSEGLPETNKPQMLNDKKLLTFPEAMQEVIMGRRITRVAWNDSDDYGLMAEGYLMLHKHGEPVDQMHCWKVTDGDLLAGDWVVVL